MTVRVGVIGVGNIGTAHARNLAGRISGSAVTAVFDADTERAVTIGAGIGARVAESAAALIHAPDVDAVLIASPDDLHASQVVTCLEVGKPTLCEKPMSPVLGDAVAVMSAEIELGRRLVTLGFMRRFDPGYAELKTRLQAGEVGAPLVVHCIHRTRRVARDQTSATSLSNSAAHEIDINRWLLGEEYATVQVIAGRSTPHSAGALQDPLLILLSTDSGVIVEIELFVNARYGYDVRCEVVASEGALELGNGSFISSARAGQRGWSVHGEWLDRFAEAYRLQLQSWIDSVRAGAAAGPSAWDGYVAAAVADSCIAALGSGVPVPVTLVSRPSLYAPSK